MKIYPMLAKVRDEVVPVPGSNPAPPMASGDAPAEVFEGLGYNSAEAKPPAPPKPNN
jgi:hypothetical protein